MLPFEQHTAAPVPKAEALVGSASGYCSVGLGL